MSIVPKGKHWYLRYMRGGKKRAVCLDVRVEGVRPENLKLTGDALFERSRNRAELRAEQVLAEIESRHDQEDLLQRIHDLRTGGEVRAVKLEDIFGGWRDVRRKSHKLSEQYVGQCQKRFASFGAFVAERKPSAKQMADVDAALAKAYLKHVEDTGVSAKSYNDILILLRSAFEGLRDEASIVRNPFIGIPTKTLDTQGRVPFSVEELSAIVDAARRPEHQFIRPIIITGTCTALRRADCCMLQWADVSFERNLIKVKTAKTGGTAHIPIFPLLRAELEQADRTGPEVFPDVAKMFGSNPDGVTWRIQRVFEAAGFYDARNPNDVGHRGNRHTAPENRLRRASVRDFHSLRTTWITLALTAGVAEELVRRVTGHAAVEVLRNFYFKPAQDALQEALAAKMPDMFLLRSKDSKPRGNAAPVQTALGMLGGMTVANWATVRDDIVALLSEPDSKAPQPT